MSAADFPFPFVSIEGPPRQRGRQYGELADERIEASLRVYMPTFAGPDATARETLYGRARRFMATIGERYPDLLEEMTGIAEGSGRDVEEIIALNARTELLFGREAASEGCTAAVILPEAGGGRVVLGQNWDWKPPCRDSAIVLRVLPETGPSILGFVEAGMLGRNGLNSAGIGLCGNFIGCDQKATRAGVPIALVRRAILQSESLPEAVGHVVRAPRSFSSNYVLAHRDGEAVDLETTPEDVFPMFPEQGLLIHANHFVAGAARVRDTGIALFPDTLFRDRRVRAALASRARPLGVADLKAAFRDHFGHPDAVCRHRPTGRQAEERRAGGIEIQTVASLIMELDEGRLWVAEGPPCEHEYRAFSLKRGAEEVLEARAAE